MTHQHRPLLWWHWLVLVAVGLLGFVFSRLMGQPTDETPPSSVPSAPPPDFKAQVGTPALPAPKSAATKDDKGPTQDQ